MGPSLCTPNVSIFLSGPWSYLELSHQSLGLSTKVSGDAVGPSEGPPGPALGGGCGMTWDGGHMPACHEQGDKMDGSAAC